MSPRASLPGAAELFRSTGASARPSIDAGPEALPAMAPMPPAAPAPTVPEAQPSLAPEPAAVALAPVDSHEALDAPRRTAVRQSSRRPRPVADRAPTGRERHEEKITVYCSAEELIDLETARLALRAEHGMAVDRGRIVREAVAVVLADLEAKGEASILVRRLREA